MFHNPHPGWPVATAHVRTIPGAGSATGDTVRLRSLQKTDGRLWCAYRLEDRALLEPVEPTTEEPWEEVHSRAGWRRTYAGLRNLALAGIVVPAAIEVNGEFAGQLTLGNIQHGTVSSAWIGYWVHSSHQGRGIATAAVALGVDHALRGVGLHRVEATVLVGNVASRRVLDKTGFRQEGVLRRNLHIDGHWQDHVLVAQTAEESESETVVGRLIRCGLLAHA